MSLKCLYSFNLCLMDLGCPLLRGSSDRRRRRCAATLPPLLERTFPGSILFFAFAEAMAAVRDLEEGNISFGVRHLSERCRRQWLSKTSPSYWRRLRSLGASILWTVLTAQVIPGYNCYRWHLRCYLPLPSLLGNLKNWAEGSSRSGMGEQLETAVQNHMALWAHLSRHRLSQSVVRAMQLMI